MTLLIISHTEHYKNAAGQICGWGPTVREIDFLAERYGRVIHIGCFYKGMKAPASTKPYESEHVEFVAIPPYGGVGIKAKLGVLRVAPQILKIVFNYLKRADVFQFRAPTSMGTYIIPALTWLSTKPGWFKYAGNWVQEKKPVSYAFQKAFLESFQKRPVTINGVWKGQKAHVYSFENPCLTEKDMALGEVCLESKRYDASLTACFVGRLEDPKGVRKIIDNLPVFQKLGISEVHFVGGGPQEDDYKILTKDASVKCHFHGFLDKDGVFEIYRKSHLILLPSKSEGFPKVIAEAAAFGCIPMVSDVSSISQYVNHENGYLWDINKLTFTEFLKSIDFQSDLKNKAVKARQFSKLFTFQSVSSKLDKYILVK